MKQKLNIPYLTITLFLTAITYLLLSIYSTAHWPLQTNAHRAKSTIESSSIPADQKTELATSTQKIIDAGFEIMKRSSLYHITGFSAFIISLIAVFRERGIKRFIPLPFGLISGFLGIITM